jgi:hypothetical protein
MGGRMRGSGIRGGGMHDGWMGCRGMSCRRLGRRQIGQCGAWLRSKSVLGLRSGRGCCARTQLFARRLASPRSGINLADHAQPLLGFAEGSEITHVEPEALAPLFEAATYKERKALQLGHVDLSEGHRSGRRAQIQNERARLGFRRRRFPGLGAPRCARSHIWRW